jgi:hypothetical protein
MRRLTLGLAAAGAFIVAAAAPAVAQIGVYIGPGGIGVEAAPPGYYYGPGPQYGYYAYAPGYRFYSEPEGYAYRYHHWDRW